MVVNLIVAYCRGNGMGKNNSLPWHIPQDLKHFSKMTKGDGVKKNIIVMGRHTWESLPKKPLPHRLNVIVSNTININEENIKTVSSLTDILTYYQSNQEIYGDLWVIGGYQIYKEVLDNNICDNIYITYIDEIYDCDVYFPSISMDKYTLVERYKLENSVSIVYHYKIITHW